MRPVRSKWLSFGLVAVVAVLVAMSSAASALPQSAGAVGQAQEGSPRQVAGRQQQSSGKPDPKGNSQKPRPEDPMEKCRAAGYCNIDGVGECALLESSSTCSAFRGFYIPRNISTYVEQRIPTIKAWMLPLISDASGIDRLFGDTNNINSTMTRYGKDYLMEKIGCEVPGQRWFKTAFCMDLFRFFHDNAYTLKGLPACAKTATPPKMCATTLDERAESIKFTTEANKVCEGAPRLMRERGEAYEKDLRQHPWRDASPNCISGESNEKDSAERSCGYNLEYGACMSKKCSKVPNGDCSSLPRSSFPSESNLAPQGMTCDPMLKSCKDPFARSKAPMIIGICVGVVVVLGVVAMFCVRSKNKMKAEDLTFGAPTLGRRPSGPGSELPPSHPTDQPMSQKPEQQQQQQPQHPGNNESYVLPEVPQHQTQFTVGFPGSSDPQPSVSAQGNMAMPMPGGQPNQASAGPAMSQPLSPPQQTISMPQPAPPQH